MLRQQYKRLVPGGASVSRRGLGLTCRGLSQVTQAKKNGERRASGRGGGGGDPLRERIYLERRENGVLKPEPLPVTHSAAFLQRSRGVWEVSEPNTTRKLHTQLFQEGQEEAFERKKSSFVKEKSRRSILQREKENLKKKKTNSLRTFPSSFRTLKFRLRKAARKGLRDLQVE